MCEECQDCDDENGMCSQRDDGREGDNPKDPHCNSCTCYRDAHKEEYTDLPKFTKYSDAAPLGPKGYFYNSAKKLVNISSMRDSYRKSSAAWIRSNFKSKHGFAMEKYSELMKGLY